MVDSQYSLEKVFSLLKYADDGRKIVGEGSVSLMFLKIGQNKTVFFPEFDGSGSLDGKQFFEFGV